MTNYAIIWIVAVITFATCAILAAVFYKIDKNAERRDTKD